MLVGLRAGPPARLAAAACCLLALAGCARRTSVAAPPQRVIVAVDRSGSTANAPARTALFEALDHVATTATVQRATMQLLLFDREVHEAWGPEVPASSRDLADIKDRELRLDAVPRRFTCPGRMFRAVATALEKCPADAVVTLVVLTDGGAELEQDRRDMIEFGGKVAADPRLRGVLVAGIRPESRALWRRALDGMAPDRVRMAGPGREMESALQQWARDLRPAGSNAHGAR